MARASTGCPSWSSSPSAICVPADSVDEALAEWRRRLGDRVLGVLAVSSATGPGLDELRSESSAICRRRLRRGREPARDSPSSRPSTASTGRPARAAIRSSAKRTARFRVRGRGVELLFERHDLANEEALDYLEQRLQEIGVIAALRNGRLRPGDDVRVGENEFELHI